MKHLPIFATLCALVSVAGCGTSEEDTVQDPPKPSTEFKGAVDDKMVGEWASADGKMKLSLKKDGSARMQATIGTRVGPQKIDTSMEWKVDGTTISFKDDKAAISRYQVTVTDKELELKSPKSVTKYLKQK